MKKLLFLTLLSLTSIGYSQKQADTSITLDSKITDINLHQLTGIPVVTTNGGVYGIDGITGEKIWEFKETSLVSALTTLGQKGGGSSFSEITNSPYGKFNNTIFNIKNGHKILDDKSNGFKSFMDTKYISGKKGILFFTKSDKTKGKLFLVGIENDTILWESEIESDKKLESLLGGGGIFNFIQNDNHIAFSGGKTIFLINKDNGEVIMTEKYDAGKLFFTEDNASLIAVEAKGGSLVGSALKAGVTMGLSMMGNPVLGKELIAYDVNSGKEAWKKSIKLDEGFIDYQFEDGKLFIMHKDGAKFYDYTSGEGIWKKDFKKKKVKAIEKAPEGYMVFYKNKQHLVDNSGKKIWKKPEKVIKNVDFEVDDEEEFTAFDYNAGTLFLTPYRIEYFKKGDSKRVYKISLDEKSDKLAYDEINKNLMLLKGKKLYILNPDKNLGKDEVKKIDFNDPEKVNSVEIRDKGYFINSNWEYIITDFTGNTVKKEYFKQPGEGLRHLKNFGSAVFAVGSAKVYTTTDSEGQVTVVLTSSADIVNSQNNKGTYVSKHGKEFEQLSNYLYSPDRFNAFKATKNSAFFYTKKNDKKVLLQLNKDTGNITETFEFGVDKPNYKIDKPAKKIFFRKGNEFKIFSYND